MLKFLMQISSVLCHQVIPSVLCYQVVPYLEHDGKCPNFLTFNIFVVQVGVCGCAGVGKEKFDLIAGGGGDKIDL